MGPPGTDNSTIPKDVNAVTRGRPHSRGRGRGNIRTHRSTVPSRRRGTPHRGRDDHRGQDNMHAHQDKCQNCGFDHHKDARCPAKGKQCTKCRRWNHFSKVCTSVCEIHEYSGVDEYGDICVNRLKMLMLM